jgi:hypothetical protein
MRFALPWKIVNSKDLGELEIIDADMPAKIKRLLWPYCSRNHAKGNFGRRQLIRVGSSVDSSRTAGALGGSEHLVSRRGLL